MLKDFRTSRRMGTDTRSVFTSTFDIESAISQQSLLRELCNVHGGARYPGLLARFVVIAMI
jgi:hypothetical protein